MKPRIIALILLLVLVGLPLFLYWYFYHSRISSISFTLDRAVSYRVEMEGALNYTYFPLLDSVFSYERDCQWVCTISGIPPLRYDIIFTASGMVPIRDSVTLVLGRETEYALDFVPALTFVSKWSPLTETPLVEWSGIIGTASNGKIYSIAPFWSNETGVFVNNASNPLFTLARIATRAGFDRSQRYLYYQSWEGIIYLSTLDGRDTIDFPSLSPPTIIEKTWDEWKVRTQDGVYTSLGNGWKKNPRFTDYIDISPRYRIGYIDRNDSAKLELQNLALQGSVFVLIDRDDPASHLLLRGKDILGFITLDRAPHVLLPDGTLELLQIDLLR